MNIKRVFPSVSTLFLLIGLAGPGILHAFGVTDADMGGMNLTYAQREVAPEPQSMIPVALGLVLLVLALPRRGKI